MNWIRNGLRSELYSPAARVREGTPVIVILDLVSLHLPVVPGSLLALGAVCGGLQLLLGRHKALGGIHQSVQEAGHGGTRGAAGRHTEALLDLAYHVKRDSVA